jgi:C-terminal processing protease CtpA/Prc
VSSWDDSFRDFGELPAAGDGFFLRKEAEPRTIEPAAEAYAGKVELLIDEANSSATFMLASIVKEHGLATLIGRETGGNRRGTNGGRVAFLKLPASGIEVDVPLVGYFPPTPQPDRGIVPDISR